jgi:hypothetical protein
LLLWWLKGELKEVGVWVGVVEMEEEANETWAEKEAVRGR